jgi:hypothetical protein
MDESEISEGRRNSPQMNTDEGAEKKARRHGGTKARREERCHSSLSLCAFVPLCLCAYPIRIHLYFICGEKLILI